MLCNRVIPFGWRSQAPFKAWRPLEADGDATAAAAYAAAEATAKAAKSCDYGEVRCDIVVSLGDHHHHLPTHHLLGSLSIRLWPGWQGCLAN